MSRASAPSLSPPVLHPFRPWPGVAGLALLVVLLAAVYALTTPRTVLLEDDGLFLMSSAVLGISHPPGYPVHTFLGWLASQVPAGTQAFRVHVLSGVLGALACGVLGWIVLRRTGSRAAAALAALAYGVSEHFWSQAILAEVYTLNALFFFVLLALCLEAAARPTPRLLVLTAAIYGLSLANHWPLMVLATPALVLTLACRWREVLARAPVLVVAMVLGGGVPYAWMVWRSLQDPAISFYGPLRSWRDVVFYISRRGYAAVEASATAGWTDKLSFAGYVTREILLALTPAGAALALAGLMRRWREDGRLGLAGEVLAFLASGVALAFLLGFDFDFLRVAVFRPYPLVAYGLLALWMGSGVHWMLSALGGRLPIRAAVTILLFALPAYLVTVNWSRNDRSRDTFADRYARVVLDLIEPDSVLLVYADSDTGPIGYLHVVEGARPDVTVYNLQGLVFSNRLLPALSGPRTRQQRLQRFLAENRRPVYHMTDRILPPGSGDEHFGFVKRLAPDARTGGPRPRFRPEAAAFFEELRRMPEPRDRWVRMTRNQLLHQYGTFLGLAQLAPDADLEARVRPLVALAEDNYYSLTGMVEALAEHGATRDAYARAADYLRKAERLADDSLDAERLGREYYLRGFVTFRLGDPAGSVKLFERSLRIHPSPENASRLALQQLAALERQRGR